MGKWLSPHKWEIEGLTKPHTNTIPQCRASLTTKLLPNPHNFNPQPAMSYTDPAPTGLASQCMPASEDELEPPDPSRHLQKCPVMSRPFQDPPDPSGMLQSTLGPSGATGIHQEQCTTLWNLRKHPGHLARHLEHLEIGLGPPWNGSTHSLMCGMCVTSPPIGLHQASCRTTSSLDQETRVTEYTPGLPGCTGSNWNKLE